MAKMAPLFPPGEGYTDEVLVSEKDESFIDGEWRPKYRVVKRAVRDVEWVEVENPRKCHWLGTVTFNGERVGVFRWRFSHTWIGHVDSVERRASA
jgi:hypothetical protein